MSLLYHLKHPKYFLFNTALALILFNVHYYFMANLPGTKGFACVMGANLTASNIIFSLFSSILTAVIVMGFVALYGKKAAEKGIYTLSLSGLGLFFGFFTVFCTICFLPVISLFGISIGLGFFTNYNLQFKVLSLAFLAAALILINRQVKDKCLVCERK